MKILMLHPHDLYSDSEPWTARIKNIAKNMVLKGHKVKLIYFSFYEKPKLKTEPIKLQGYEEIPLRRQNRYMLENIIKVYQHTKWADIIHFQKCFSHASLPAILAGYLQAKPVHYDWDDWEIKICRDSGGNGVFAYYLDILEKMVPKLADTVSCASERLRVLCLQKGIKEERIFDSHVGADLTEFNPDIKKDKIREKYNLKKFVVLYLGQLHGAQYADLFIKAAKIISAKRQDASFIIVGDGSNLENLKILVNDLNLQKNVIFTGHIAHHLIPEYIAACDVAVACFEDNEITRCKSPLKVVEYMASGKAIVASAVGEVKRMLDGCGMLTKPGDSVSLAAGIEKLLDNGSLRKEMGKRARKRAEEVYNWSVTADNLLQAYRAALRSYQK